MAKVGTVLNVTTKDTEGKIKESTITYANPEASDADLKKFVKAMNNLSDDTLKNLQRAVTSNIDLTDDENP